MTARQTELVNFLKKKKGLATYSELLEAGFNKAVLNTCLKAGRAEKIDRALYRASDGPSLSHPDLVAVSIKAPTGVICLISALSFHKITDEIPRQVDVAILRGSHANKIKYPPVRFYRFDPPSYERGVEDHVIGRHKVKVYNLAKTIADCFKFRNKIGTNIALNALKTAIAEKRVKSKDIMQYAKICRIDRIIKPMLEALS